MTAPKIIAMIPARMGSERLRYKNLRLLNSKPVIGYAIEAALESEVFDSVTVNSEDEIFSKIADRYGVGFYKRPHELGSSDTRSDDVVYDFMKHNPGDILVWVNSTAPLQTADEIKGAVEYMQQGSFDTVMTVKQEYLHSLHKGKPINFSLSEKFAKTQDLSPIVSIVYSLMMWRYDGFINAFVENGHAILFGRIGYFPVSKESAALIKHEEDLLFCEALIKSREDREVEYDPVFEKNRDSYGYTV